MLFLLPGYFANILQRLIIKCVSIAKDYLLIACRLTSSQNRVNTPAKILSAELFVNPFGTIITRLVGTRQEFGFDDS